MKHLGFLATLITVCLNAGTANADLVGTVSTAPKERVRGRSGFALAGVAAQILAQCNDHCPMAVSGSWRLVRRGMGDLKP
jgi:hypothetical protein